jgi:hypothetical protein
MSAAAAASPQRPVQIPGGWFHCPNAIADNLARLTPAEAYLVLVAFRYGSAGQAAAVTDEMWAKTTRMTPQSRRNAERGLIEHRLLHKSLRAYDVRGFLGWARHADPEERRTAGRGPTKSAQVTKYRRHPECEQGCAVVLGRASLLSIGYEPDRKPVLPSVRGDDAQVGPVEPAIKALASDPPFEHPQAGGPTIEPEPEARWPKTLAAMRSGFATAGVELLMRLLRLLFSLADLSMVSDYTLAAAVTRSYLEGGRRMAGPGLLLTTVPEVLRAWRKQGRALDATGPPEEEPLPVIPYAREPEDSPDPSVWMRVRLRLKGRIGEHDYQNWVARAEFGERDGADVVVLVPDAVTAEWIEQEYRGLISEIARQLELDVERFRFRPARDERRAVL